MVVIRRHYFGALVLFALERNKPCLMSNIHPASHPTLSFLVGLLPPSQVHQLEFILDSLVDEKDRSTQKRGETGNGRAAGAGAGHGSIASASDGSSQLSLEISVSRPAEIEAALQQFVSPKVLALAVSFTAAAVVPSASVSSLNFCRRWGQSTPQLNTLRSPIASYLQLSAALCRSLDPSSCTGTTPSSCFLSCVIVSTCLQGARCTAAGRP